MVMYNNFLDSVNAAFHRDEEKLEKQIQSLRNVIESKRVRSVELEAIYKEQIIRFNDMLAEYGYKIIGYSMFNFESNRVSLVIQKGDGIKHHVDIASNNKKKTGRYYMTLRGKFDETMYNKEYSDDWAEQERVMLNAMNARPRCHVRVDSCRELKDIFFTLLNGMEEVRRTQSSEHYSQGICYKARIDMRTLNLLNTLD